MLFEWLPAASPRHVQGSMFHRPGSQRRFGRGVAELASTLPTATGGSTRTQSPRTFAASAASGNGGWKDVEQDRRRGRSRRQVP